MAEILIKIKIEGNSNALAFVERTRPYLSKTLKEIRQGIVSEVGELLPPNFKFVRTGIPVSAIPGGGGVLGRCGAAPITLTLFKTNIADFPTLFKTEFRFFNILFKTFNPNINLITSTCKNSAIYRPRKHILLKTKIDKLIP